MITHYQKQGIRNKYKVYTFIVKMTYWQLGIGETVKHLHAYEHAKRAVTQFHSHLTATYQSGLTFLCFCLNEVWISNKVSNYTHSHDLYILFQMFLVIIWTWVNGRHTFCIILKLYSIFSVKKGFLCYICTSFYIAFRNYWYSYSL